MAPPSIASIGGTSSGNPMIPSTPSGQAVNPTAMPAYGSPYTASGATAALAGGGTMTNAQGVQTNLLGMQTSPAQQNDLATSFQHAGFKGGIGTAMAEFLTSGAGFNPDVANALIAAMQPQIAKGQANLMEQFGAQGLAGGSPAALGMGDYLAQTNLDVGTLLSGMYEQSVTNYMNMLTQGKSYTGPPEWEQALNAVLSGGSQAVGTAAMSTCWIAAVLYDEDLYSGPRVNKIRQWLDQVYSKTRMGKIVVNLYEKYGKQIADIIANHSWLKLIFRPLFDLALRKSEEQHG
jgi:hypothetical protein